MELLKEIEKYTQSGYKVEYLGQLKEKDVYQCFFPDSKTGFPLVLIHSNGFVKEVTGFDAVEIVSKFTEE